MSDARAANITRNLYWGFIARVVGIAIPFLTRTVMIYVLGMRYVGLDSLFASLLGLLSLTELGVGGALVFSMYSPVARNDVRAVNALLAFYRKCYRIIGVIITVLGVCMLPFLRYLVKGDMPEDVNMHVLFCVQLFQTAIGYFAFAYKGSIFQVKQRGDVQQRIALVLSVAMNLSRTMILLICRNYYVYVLVGPIGTLLQNLMTAYYAKKMYPEFFCEGTIGEREKAEIASKVKGLLFQKIGGVVLFSVDALVISAFLGLRVLGVYNGYYYIVSAVVGFISVVQGALIPSVGNAIAMESKEKNYRDFRKVHFLMIWMLTWWSACLLCLLQPFVELWQGKENMLSFGMVILFVLYFYLHHAGDVAYVYKEAAGLWWEGRYYSLIAAAVNLALNLITVQTMGLPGILLSTIAALLFAHIPYGAWVLFRHYFDSKERYLFFLKRMVLYFVVAVIVSGVTWAACERVPFTNLWLQLLIRTIICTVLPNVVFMVIYWRLDDFQDFLHYLAKLAATDV